jgi:hypothetical protein
MYTRKTLVRQMGNNLRKGVNDTTGDIVNMIVVAFNWLQSAIKSGYLDDLIILPETVAKKWQNRLVEVSF